MKKFAGQNAGRILHQQVIDGSMTAGKSREAAIGDRALHGVRRSRNDLGDVAEMGAIFIAKRQIPEQIAYSVNAAACQDGSAMRANAFQIRYVG